MADQTDFKHITVNPAETDDVVIHAGAPAAAQDAPSAARPASHPSQPESTTASPASADSPSDSSSSARPAKKDAYRQTTLEDIQSFKMSKTQIAVIVVALAAIVAFVVWYLVFS